MRAREYKVNKLRFFFCANLAFFTRASFFLSFAAAAVASDKERGTLTANCGTTGGFLWSRANGKFIKSLCYIRTNSFLFSSSFLFCSVPRSLAHNRQFLHHQHHHHRLSQFLPRGRGEAVSMLSKEKHYSSWDSLQLFAYCYLPTRRVCRKGEKSIEPQCFYIYRPFFHRNRER